MDTASTVDRASRRAPLARAVATALALLLGAGALAAEPPPSDALEPFLEPPREPAADQGVTLGLRVAYAIPFGSYRGTPGSGLGDFISGALPLQVDAGYRFKQFYFGGFFQYAPAFLPSSLPLTGTLVCSASEVSCTGHFIRLGAEVQYSIRPRTVISPWVGLGFGYEWAHGEASSPTEAAGLTLSGFEFANLQGGVDFPLGKGFRLGPYAMLTIAQYGSASGSATGLQGGTASASIEDKAFHEWLHLGARLALDL